MLTEEKSEIIGALLGDKSLLGFFADMVITRDMIIHVINRELFAFPSAKTRNGGIIFLN